MNIASFHQQVSTDSASPLALLQNPATVLEQLSSQLNRGWPIWPR